MTIKVIAMLARKPGLSETDFVDYYENRHAPLILSIAPQIRDYRRNYLRREGAILATGARPPDFDVVTELWFDDQEAFDAAMVGVHRSRECCADRARRGECLRSEQDDVFRRNRTRRKNTFNRSRTMFFVATERGGGRQHDGQS